MNMTHLAGVSYPCLVPDAMKRRLQNVPRARRAVKLTFPRGDDSERMYICQYDSIEHLSDICHAQCRNRETRC
jgi:hypothetical protein